jgi:N-methylhydantoinase A
MYKVGIDVGGTFTDFTLQEEASGAIRFYKVPSTPRDPSEAIAQGMAQLLENFATPAKSVSHVSHGTTVATNIVIERRGAPTGLLITRGFRDIIEIGRQTRPRVYDYAAVKPPPLVPRELRLEIDERLAADGTVLRPLEDGEVEVAAASLRAAGVKAVAVCFLHSYRNAAHERRAREILERLIPGAYVSISSDVLPEFREYERLSTTVLNSYVGPPMDAYLGRFVEKARKIGVEGNPYTIHSNGGLMSPVTARAFPVRTCLSGPAAGVVGAAEIGKAAGFPNLISFDVGGTSTDVSLVPDGQPIFASQRLVAEYPVKMPMIDIHVIGAGGGSIAWIDDAGGLKVGPQSAGADPGPVAFGRGGERVTITDANICLHRLNPESLLDGRLRVDEAASRAAISRQIASPLGLSVEAAAEGIVRIANASMSRAIRSVSTERGNDLSRFALFAFGGAGALHAVDVAQGCGIPTVVVPQEPGTMCARGMLLSHLSIDFVRTLIAPADACSWERLRTLFGEMRGAAEEWFERERIEPARRLLRHHIDARHEGQNYEVAVSIDPEGEDALTTFLRDFRVAHAKEYGHDIPGRGVEIVNCRTQAVGLLARGALKPHDRRGRIEDALRGKRDVWFGAGDGWTSTPVYWRDDLPSEARLKGPAIIEEMSSTIVLTPGRDARVDPLGNVVIAMNGAA